ncbi:hypothetical protein F4819DRAFT_12500 [Hypoxylon fuscum]|nr:hypothetical protein F4819DRAFT_12500 [Hypoxylon fuscum]
MVRALVPSMGHIERAQQQSSSIHTVAWCSWLSRQSNTLKVSSSSLDAIIFFLVTMTTRYIYLSFPLGIDRPLFGVPDAGSRNMKLFRLDEKHGKYLHLAFHYAADFPLIHHSHDMQLFRLTWNQSDAVPVILLGRLVESLAIDYYLYFILDRTALNEFLYQSIAPLFPLSPGGEETCWSQQYRNRCLIDYFEISCDCMISVR